MTPVRHSGPGLERYAATFSGAVLPTPESLCTLTCGSVPKSVIATPPEAPQLSTYLARLHQAMQPNSKQEYLLPYPGFAQTFGLPLDLPERGHDGWVDLPETFLEASVEEGAAAVSQVIRSAIDRLAATTAPNVVLIFVPARWKK